LCIPMTEYEYGIPLFFSVPVFEGADASLTHCR
jgi:hypothetical protein